MSDAIYLSAHCAGCSVVRQALLRNPIREVSLQAIDTDARAAQAFRMLGFQHIPAASIGGQHFVGAPDILQALRAKYGRP